MHKKVLDHIVAIGTAVSALGIVFAGWQVVLIRDQVKDAATQTELTQRTIERYFDQAQKAVAFQALLDWTRDQPTNSAHCIEAVSGMNSVTFSAVVDRTEVSIPSELHENILRCFSDIDTDLLPKFFDGTTLTRRGSSMLVERVRRALNADEQAARAVNYSLGNKEMIDEGVKNAVNSEDTKIISLLNKKLGRPTFEPIIKYLHPPSSDKNSHP